MTADLRDALADLATEAPAIDVVDRAIAGGRVRRRARITAGLAIVAVVAVATPIITTTVADQTRGQPSSPAPAGEGTFEPDIRGSWWPWASDQLPSTLEEPITMAVEGLNGAGVATVSGRWWSLGVSSAVSVAPNGWTVAWWSASIQELTIRNLVSGDEQRISAGRATQFDGLVIDPQVPLRWSPDGASLAVTGTMGEVSIIDVDTGAVAEMPTALGSVAGWLDNLNVVTVGHLTELGQEISRVRLDGSITSLGFIPPEGRATEVVPSLSLDGEELAWFETEPDGSVTVRYWSLDRGGAGEVSCECVQIGSAPVWSADGRRVVIVQRADFGPRVLETLEITPPSNPLLVLSPFLVQPTQVALAANVIENGPVGSPHTSAWWPGWYLDWITYAGVALLVLVLALIWRSIHARRRRSPTGP